MPTPLTDPARLREFLSRLGARCPAPAAIYLFGGSAVMWLGGARHTGDVDFTLDAAAPPGLRSILSAVAEELDLDVEESDPAGFMPLPGGVEARHQLIGQYGPLSAFIFDPYSLALMKIDRAFETDLQDVRFLLRQGHLRLDTLEQCVEDVARRYDEPRKLRRHLQELKRGL